MGFGHRVYKNYDPRAKIIREVCCQVLEKLADSSNPLFELAMRLEDRIKDGTSWKKKLYPNVDFYSGIIYRALGIPDNMFTVMFAITRTAGWISHWMEMLDDQSTASDARGSAGRRGARLRTGHATLIRSVLAATVRRGRRHPASPGDHR